jgi:hypothetical protein
MLDHGDLAFVGSGVMAEAMIRGILKQELLSPERIIASGPRAERGRELQKRYGVRWTTQNTEAVEHAEVVVLSVKPQVMPKILPELRGHIKPGALVLSIAAGVPIRTLREGLTHDAVVRSMPNTPAQVGAGMTVWTMSELTTEEQQTQAQSVHRLEWHWTCLRLPVHGSPHRRWRPSRVLAPDLGEAGDADCVGISAVRHGVGVSPSRAEEHGYFSWRHVCRSTVSTGQRWTADRSVSRCLGRVSAITGPGWRRGASGEE